MDDHRTPAVRISRLRALPLAVWGALAVLLSGTATLIGATFGGFYVALGVLGAALALAAAGGYALGQQFERIRARALAELVTGENPDASPRPAERALRGFRELRRLEEAMSALRQRIQVADEVAERYRRDADSAGMGMFELLSGLVAAEEATRGQLAAELHDTVAQSLGAARRLLADHCDPQQLWVEVAPLVEEAEEALRATMARTRPPALRDGDLAAAVSILRDDLDMRYGLRVALEWPNVEYPLPLATAVTLYRFFQEGLLNVLKHADVDEAVASLTVDRQHLAAVVRDNGPGFDMAQQPAAGVGGRHVGLGLLRERARLAGGTVEVMSAPGAGTMLTLRLPRPAAPPNWTEPADEARPLDQVGSGTRTSEPSALSAHAAGQ
jgi:signal transduction histidine kinase